MKAIDAMIWIGIGALLIITALLLHTHEATALVRCDGKDVFPYHPDVDNVVEGEIKMDNAISVALFNAKIKLYEPTSEGYKYIVFQPGCKFVTIGDWEFR